MQSVIETIKQRLPIADVLSSYITLIPAGSQFKAKCPFHNERTASFSVSPDRGLYYCFGCGVKGDIVTFVEQFEGVDFKGALKILADRAGVPLTDDYGTREKTDGIYSVLEKTALKYQAELAKHPEVLAYLAKRGVTPETIASFRIGYAPSEWRFVASAFSGNELRDAQDAGLVKKTEKGYYDRFRSRIMFPLCDSSGRVVGFSGRLFPDEPDAPKYLNSPETAVFQKSRILFGFDKAKFAIKKHGFAILVEGQMDVVMSHQAGFRNTVATSGTAVSESIQDDATAQLAVLARLTPQLFLAFDGDKAGQKALRHAATVALGLGMNPKVVALPEGVDPADYFLGQSTDDWKELLKKSQHFIMHELSVLVREETSPHGAVRLLRERIFPYLAKVLSPIERNMYLEQIARELGTSVDGVALELGQYMTQTPQQERSVESAVSPVRASFGPAERLIGLSEISEGARGILEKLLTLSIHGDTLLLPELDAPTHEEARLRAGEEYGALDEGAKVSVATELAWKIEQQFVASLREKYTRQLRDAERDHNDTEVARMLQRLGELASRRHTA